MDKKQDNPSKLFYHWQNKSNVICIDICKCATRDLEIWTLIWTAWNMASRDQDGCVKWLNSDYYTILDGGLNSDKHQWRQIILHGGSHSYKFLRIKQDKSLIKTSDERAMLAQKTLSRYRKMVTIPFFVSEWIGSYINNLEKCSAARSSLPHGSLGRRTGPNWQSRHMTK